MVEDTIQGDQDSYNPVQPEPVNHDLSTVGSMTPDPTIAQAVEVSQGLISEGAREIPATAITDEHKASIMAHESHELRSDAAEHSEAASYTDKIFNGIRESDTEAIRNPKDWFAENPKNGPRRGEISKTIEEALDENIKESSVAKGLRDYGDVLDVKAGAIEDWAGVLHDHNISEEYKMKYPAVEFTPRGLAALEELNADDINDINELQKALDGLSGMDVAKGIGVSGTPEDGIQNLIDRIHGTQEYITKLQEWSELRSNHTTLGQIKDFYANLYTKAHITPKQARASIINNLFNEIKSGQASVSIENSEQNFE